ncbi:hypothetical protein QUF74_01160 [Candidatus Halobeggiatoa sp. HSG11]|nr:hypothetical protein [Candidatus Halobeggiatoa sp. HSG11]
MKFVYAVLNWGFGLLFLLLGTFGILAESVLQGIPFIFISLILLPPVRNFVYSKTRKEMSVVVRTILIFVFLGVFGVFNHQNMEKKHAQNLATQQAKQKNEQQRLERKQQKLVYFNANREQIILDIKASLTAKEYQSVLSQSNKYLVLDDKELNELNAIAKTELADIEKAEQAEKKRLADIEKAEQAEIRKAELAEKKRLADIEKAEKTKQLLAELKNVPVEQYEKNRDLYQQLAKINPDNKKYKQKISFYSSKIKESNQKWYEGGTLHEKKGVDWREASQKNKLATCADFIWTWHQKKLLNDLLTKNITTTDDIKFLANKMVVRLDAYSKDKQFVNLKIRISAGLVAFDMGWITIEK